MYLFDVVTDSVMTVEYYNKWTSEHETITNYAISNDSLVSGLRCNETSYDLKDYPTCLGNKPKF